MHGHMAGRENSPAFSEPWQELCIAIVHKAADDYIDVLRKLWKSGVSVQAKRKLLKDKIELESFFHSEWYEFLCDIPPERLMRGCIPLVEQYRWQNDSSDGYIVSKRTGMKLHRLIAGVCDSKTMVDHINRDRKDCRRANLRIISPFGNSCNHKLFGTNKTGYTGVYYSRHSGRYEVKVGYNHKRIKLGTSKDDLVTLAQMYNIGAQFFFGEYVGELNNVPPPSEDLVRQVIEKCQKYKEAPARAAGASVA